MTNNILILAAGKSNSTSAEREFPLCLTEIDGVSLLEKLVENTKGIPDAKYVFAMLDKDIQRFHLDNVANLLAKGSKVVRVPEATQGSACTALLAASQMDPEGSLLIISANELVDLDLAMVVADFSARGLDAGTLIFKSVHPRYSFVRLNKEGHVIEAAQQNPISSHATVGVFWYARTKDFVESTKQMIRKNAVVAGNFYVAPVFNELILSGGKVGVLNLDVRKYHPLKTDRQVELFERGQA